jgi:dTDP-4-amino-4,6-dideoxygalactose transaminase
LLGGSLSYARVVSVADREILIARPTVGHAELDAVRAVLDSGWLGMGEVAREFERRIAELIGVSHVIGVSSGSAALHLAFAALALAPGDEVVLPSLTHVSCAHAVVAAGATPLFCDVGAETATLDPTSVVRAIGPRTRAIILVHYGGFGSRVDDLVMVAHDHGLGIIEDAAHALGSHHDGRPLGSIGDLSCLSFDPLKNITCGEGGAIATSDAGLATQLRASRNLGIQTDSLERRRSETPWFYEAASTGMRYHLPDLNAAIGLAQLERFDERRARKQAIVRRYRDGLAEIDGIEALAGDIDVTFPFLCAARISGGRRDGVVEFLGAHGIQAWVHFVPCHLQPAFSAYARSLPVTERLYGELVSLPLHADLDDADVDRVLAAIRDALEAAP